MAKAAGAEPKAKAKAPAKKKKAAVKKIAGTNFTLYKDCLLYTSPSPRDRTRSRMPSSA